MNKKEKGVGTIGFLIGIAAVIITLIVLVPTLTGNPFDMPDGTPGTETYVFADIEVELRTPTRDFGNVEIIDQNIETKKVTTFSFSPLYFGAGATHEGELVFKVKQGSKIVNEKSIDFKIEEGDLQWRAKKWFDISNLKLGKEGSGSVTVIIEVVDLHGDEMDSFEKSLTI